MIYVRLSYKIEGRQVPGYLHNGKGGEYQYINFGECGARNEKIDTKAHVS